MNALTHSDKYDQFLLGRVRQISDDMSSIGRNLMHYSQQIAELPEWDTEAEAAVKRAEDVLAAALLAVGLVNKEFKRRRVEFFGVAAE